MEYSFFLRFFPWWGEDTPFHAPLLGVPLRPDSGYAVVLNPLQITIAQRQHVGTNV